MHRIFTGRPLRIALSFILGLASAGASAQTTPPIAVPAPVATVAAGTGTAGVTTCTTGIATTSGVSYGDGCAAATAGLAAPQGVSVDKLGNIYIADYTDRLIRVVYAGGTQLAAAITAANSGYTISATRSAPAPAPVAGNIYTLAGLGTAPAALTVTGTGGAFYCANYAATGQPFALNSLGDGCPAASAPIGARAVQPDSDGNLFFVDYTNSRVRVFCVNCASATTAAQLITLENPGVTPVNGAMYTVAGYAGGYRDAALGFGSATSATLAVALLRSPTALSVSASDDLYIGDQGNNAVRLLYNGGAPALALLTAEGITPTRGFVYTIAGAGCVSAALGKTGSVTSANSCLTSTPTDSVLGNASGVNTPWSVFLDPNQNLFIGDGGNGRVRVLYGGIANPLTLTGTLTLGDIYTFAGTGASTANGIAPSQLSLSAAGTAAEGIAGDASGNLFLVDYSRAVIYEVYANTGTLTAIVGSTPSSTLAAGGFCNGLAAGPASTNTFGDGCPATQSKLTAPRGSVAVDLSGNLYFGDSSDNIVQKYSYATPFPATATGANSSSQPIAFTFNAPSTVVSVSTTQGGATTSEYALTGTSTCVLAAVSGGTCTANVAFAPIHSGLRSGAVILNAATGVIGSELLSGNGLGAALDADPATVVTLGTTLQPAGIAVDGAGRVLVTDLTSKSLIRYAGTTPTTLATGFTAPSGVAVDGAGNVFIADSSANVVREIPINGAGIFTLVSGLNAPHGLAIDLSGNLLIANTGGNAILTVTPNGTYSTPVPFTKLSAPQAVAVDGLGNFYAADTGNARVLRLTPAGVQTVVASVASAGLAVDPAGDLFLFAGSALNEYPVAGASVAVANGLATPRAVVLDADGNVFVADAGKTGVLTLNRTVPAYTFTSSPANNLFTVTSSGNAAFVPATPFLSSSDTTHFTVTPASTSGCSGTLAVGATCNVNAVFSSATAGTFTDNVTFNGNATNAPGLTLLGTNTAESTSTTFTVSATSVTYGTAVTFNATVKGAATIPTSGTVAFRNGSTTLGTANVGAGGLASVAIVLPAGSLSITAIFTPAGINYAASTSPATAVNVSPAVLTVAAANASRQFGTANPAFTYTITGFVNGDTQASATTGAPSETSSANATSPQGGYAIVITQGTLGAANYTFTFTNGTLTVTPASPVIMLSSNTLSTYGGNPVTLTSTLASSVGTPTGTITFYSGTTSLGAVPVAGGGAILSTTALPVGTDSVTAVYSGDTAFASVTATPVTITVGVPFSLAPSATTLVFPHGYQEAQSIFTVNPGGRTDTLSFACSGLPVKISCTFVPPTLALAGLTGPQTVTLLVSNSGASAALHPGPLTSPTALFTAMLDVSLLAAARRRRLLLRLLALLLAAGLASTVLTGCGSSVVNTQQSMGTYPFTVTVSSGSTVVQTIPFTLTVQ